MGMGLLIVGYFRTFGLQHLPVCKKWQGARQDFRGRQNSALNQGAERPGAAQFLFPNGIIVPRAAHLPSFSYLCPEISQSCPDFCPDFESCPDKISSKPALLFSLEHLQPYWSFVWLKQHWLSRLNGIQTNLCLDKSSSIDFYNCSIEAS